MSGYYPPIGETMLVNIVRAIRNLYEGRSIAMGEFTLAPNATQTVVIAPNVGPQSRIALTPRTASAAAALTSVYIPAANMGQGSFTVEHNSHAATDRTFGFLVQG
ncbi:MAG TPA: hypothetical protein VNK52_16070 [Hyphomicrobiaceae bacterium]|nr:hypothetical protein [Hyphomicrobiaceae bacterium]